MVSFGPIAASHAPIVDLGACQRWAELHTHKSSRWRGCWPRGRGCRPEDGLLALTRCC